MSTVDVAAWVGTYPFRSIRSSSLDTLASKARELSIDTFIVSSFESVFQENHLDAFERWHARIADIDSLEHWPVVDPSMPRCLARLQRIVERYRPRGIRLLPNYHGYSLRDGVIDDLMVFAEEQGLVTQIFTMIADPRWHYMLKVPPVAPEDYEHLTSVHPDAKLLISGQQPLQRLASRANECPNLYLDVSRVRGPVFAMTSLLDALPAEKLVFGSLWPIQIIEATLWQVTKARLAEQTQCLLLQDNVKRMLGE